MQWPQLLSKLSGTVNDELLIQNRLLKAQLEELQRHNPQRIRFTDFFKHQAARLAKQLTPESLEEVCVLVRPSTLITWHRKLIAQKFDGSDNRSCPGRPRIDQQLEALICEMAEQNRWGAERIKGALIQLGHKISHQTVLNVLKRNGLHPRPQRGLDDSWSEFIQQHASLFVASDFFTETVWSLKGLVTYYVLFFIQLDTRQVHIAGITQHPTERWMLQMARNVTACDEPFFSNRKYLIMDNDKNFTRQYQRIFRASGIQIQKIPPYSPNLNAYSERWIRSIREDCLERLIIYGPRMLKHAVRQYVTFYNSERPHQGIDQRKPSDWSQEGHFIGEKSEVNRPGIRVSRRLGGLLKYYYRETNVLGANLDS